MISLCCGVSAALLLAQALPAPPCRSSGRTRLAQPAGASCHRKDAAQRQPQRCQRGRHGVRRPVRPPRRPHVSDRRQREASQSCWRRHDQFTKNVVVLVSHNYPYLCPPTSRYLAGSRVRNKSKKSQRGSASGDEGLVTTQTGCVTTMLEEDVRNKKIMPF